MKKYTKIVSAMITEALDDKLQRAAQSASMKKSTVIRELIEEGLASMDDKTVQP